MLVHLFACFQDCLTQLLEEDGIVWLYLNQEDWIVKGYALQCLGSMCLKYNVIYSFSYYMLRNIITKCLCSLVKA